MTTYPISESAQVVRASNSPPHDLTTKQTHSIHRVAQLTFDSIGSGNNESHTRPGTDWFRGNDDRLLKSLPCKQLSQRTTVGHRDDE
jgi:hypothetical protein